MIEGHKACVVFFGQGEKIDVCDLLVSYEVFVLEQGFVGDGDIIRPKETMLLLHEMQRIESFPHF